jgi:hypothetical protein
VNAPFRDLETMAVPHVYTAISAVLAALSTRGIEKLRKNAQGSGYNFRGIDDCYNAIAPLMAQHGLCMFPRMMQRDVQERTSAKGNVLIYTTVHAEFDFVSAKDGSKHTVATFGEAMDSGDKSCNKAMSAAQKYAILQTFVVPTEGDNDSENQTHEVAQNPLLPALREAAMKGMDALMKAHGESSKLPGFKDVWKQHSEALKALAAQVPV